MKLNYTKIVQFVILAALLSLPVGCGGPEEKESAPHEQTKAIESSYNQNMREATTSHSLSKADLSWHALNTYGWDCPEVISENDKNSDGYFMIECSNGKKLRVYPRPNKHPKITNMEGGYR